MWLAAPVLNSPALYMLKPFLGDCKRENAGEIICPYLYSHIWEFPILLFFFSLLFFLLFFNNAESISKSLKLHQLLQIKVSNTFFLEIIFMRVYLSQTDDIICLGAKSQMLPPILNRTLTAFGHSLTLLI